MYTYVYIPNMSWAPKKRQYGGDAVQYRGWGLLDWSLPNTEVIKVSPGFRHRYSHEPLPQPQSWHGERRGFPSLQGCAWHFTSLELCDCLPKTTSSWGHFPEVLTSRPLASNGPTPVLAGKYILGHQCSHLSSLLAQSFGQPAVCPSSIQPSASSHPLPFSKPSLTPAEG